MLPLLALAPYVFLSSYLGLTGRFGLVMDVGGALGFMGAVWGASVFADLVFVAGNVAAAAAGYALAQRGQAVGGALAAAALAWATYAFSFLALTQTAAFRSMSLGGIVGTFEFVGMFGIAGILFAAIAPPATALAMRARASRRVSAPG